jgi:hypothetical protein
MPSARVLRLALALSLIGPAAGCRPAPLNATPEGAVRELVERLDGGGDGRAVFDLLSERARANLQARAERYTNASGRKIEPWAMLVPARTRLRFAPHSYKARMAGRYALVDVLGVRPDQVAHVPCVLEKKLWRVDLQLPELPPMPRRPGGEGL